MTHFSTLDALVAWCLAAPDGTSMDARELGGILRDLEPDAPSEESALTVDPVGEWTWRERIWTVPAERRLGTREVLEALGRSRTWLYRAMCEEQGPDRFPHRKLDGELVFTAGEVRHWIRSQEETIYGLPMDSTTEERDGKVTHVG